MKLNCKKCTREFDTEINPVDPSEKWSLKGASQGMRMSSHRHPVSFGTHVAALSILHATKHICEKKCVCPYCGEDHRGIHILGTALKNFWNGTKDEPKKPASKRLIPKKTSNKKTVARRK